MPTDFPQAVPEIPVSNVEQAAGYYVTVLGFSFDWGDDDGGIGGISQGDCRMFLANELFRAVHGPRSPVIVWLNLNSKQEVDELSERWKQLVDESLVLPGLLDRRKVETLVDWARQLEFYTLRFSSIASSLQAVREITAAH